MMKKAKHYYVGRVDYKTYHFLLKHGYVQKLEDKGLNIFQSWHTLKKLGYESNVVLHEELYDIEVKSWKERADELKEIIQNLL